MERNNITFTENEPKVTIPLESYNELIRTDERMNILIRRLKEKDGEYIKSSELLSVLGKEK